MIDEAGIISETSLVIGMPDDTVESMKGTAKPAQFYKKMAQLPQMSKFKRDYMKNFTGNFRTWSATARGLD